MNERGNPVPEVKTLFEAQIVVQAINADVVDLQVRETVNREPTGRVKSIQRTLSFFSDEQQGTLAEGSRGWYWRRQITEPDGEQQTTSRVVMEPHGLRTPEELKQLLGMVFRNSLS